MNARFFFVGSLLAASCWLSAPIAHATRDVENSEHYEASPRRTLLRGGGWTLGATYVAAAVTAAASRRPVDDWLYVPLAGPWLDLARAHEGETRWRNGLLIADGVGQALGALQLVGAFVFPELHRVSIETEHEPPPQALVVQAGPWLSTKGVGLRAGAAF